jgi:hypothetical protein
LVLSTLIRTTLRKFMDAMAQAACMVDSAVNRDELWVQVVQERAIQFAKANAEAGFALASGLAKAKDLHPQVEISGPSSPSGQQ